jgi:hypothetical protein
MSRRRAGALEFAVSAILALTLLFLATVLLSRHDLVRDLSFGQRRTLAPQTVAVVEMIERPIQIVAFYADDPQEQARLLNLVERYREQTPLLDIRFVDVDRRPDVASEYGVSTNRTVVLEDGDLRVRIYDPDEAALTAGLIRVLRAEAPQVFFVTGHGESSVEDDAGSGLMEAARMLMEQNFELRTLNTAVIPRVPESASLLVLAGPTREYTDSEIAIIDDYLMRGGRLLAALEPGGAKSVDSLLTRWGIEPGDGYVIDASEEQRNLLGGHPIARALFEANPLPSGVTIDPLIHTGQRTWLERTPSSDGATVFDDGTDFLGPLALGIAATVNLPVFAAGNVSVQGLSGNLIEMAAEQNDMRDSTLAGAQQLGDQEFASGLAKNARIVAFGDIDFANNANLRVHGNGDLFLASVLWLTEQEDRIALPPRPELSDPFILGARRTQMLQWFGIGAVPALFFLAGGITLWRRRRWV